MKLVNYHTHTIRCQHATGSEEEYIEEAIRLGFKTLGFADHTPWHYDTDFISGVRMHENELANYVSTLKDLKDKYKDKIEILIGLEAEYYPDMIDWLIEQCKSLGIDYLIFGCHFYPCDDDYFDFYSFFNETREDALDVYVNAIKQGVETGLYSYIAHPDVILRSCKVVDEKVLDAFEKITDIAIKHDIPLEYNLNGVYWNKYKGINSYPHDDFWKIAGRKGCKALVGFDAHRPSFFEEMMPSYNEGNEKLKQFGCQLIDTIDVNKLK